jgi:hypothetical protein
MKALTIRQPWVNLILEGKKTLEVRAWRTSHRGALVITSSARPRIHPYGAAVAIVTIFNCRRMDVTDEPVAMVEYDHVFFVWELTRLMRLDPVLPCKGKLGLWEINEYTVPGWNAEIERSYESWLSMNT